MIVSFSVVFVFQHAYNGRVDVFIDWFLRYLNETESTVELLESVISPEI